MDLYCKMGDELRALFNDLFDPRLEGAVRNRLNKILDTASQIGGSIQKQAERLNKDVIQFLERPGDHKLLENMKKHAMKLEQETREI